MLFKELKAARPFFLMAGPNTIQSEEHCLKMARCLKAVTASLGIPLIFKASFDKANRTSASSFRGPGMKEGLRILKVVKEQVGVNIITDAHEVWQMDAVAEVSCSNATRRDAMPAGLYGSKPASHAGLRAQRPSRLCRRAACRAALSACALPLDGRGSLGAGG